MPERQRTFLIKEIMGKEKTLEHDEKTLALYFKFEPVMGKHAKD